jgi:hypothetical protein
MRRTGPLPDRLALCALRFGAVAWGVAERVGIDLVGASEGPPLRSDPEREAELDALVQVALEDGGTIDAAGCPFPAHELLTRLAVGHGLLLHGSNDTSLSVLEPRPARDFRTELRAVVATDDGVWPLFYAVVARERVDGVFTACLHAGRHRRYLFATWADPRDASSWTRGAVYAVPRAGFRREWGREWVRAEPVEPALRVLVRPEDFPLRDEVIAAPTDMRRLPASFRAAKRARAA